MSETEMHVCKYCGYISESGHKFQKSKEDWEFTCNDCFNFLFTLEGEEDGQKDDEGDKGYQSSGVETQEGREAQREVDCN